MGSIFRFKQFDVDQEGCAMKINTDGVLLGAIAGIECPKRILDIGTGTGVIAMMLAQRFSQAYVQAVEIDMQAAEVARSNFEKSAFKERMGITAGSFEEITQWDYYDLIVSNPPFYTNSLHNPDQRKKTARHTDFTFFKQMLASAMRLLTPLGQLQMILPDELAQEVCHVATDYGFQVYWTQALRSFEDTDVIRQIICLGKQPCMAVRRDDFVIYAERGVYSASYMDLLKPFFLAF